MIAAVVMMLIVGAVLGLILGIAGNVFKVEIDERIEKVTSLLPGYNCGGCGYAGCSGMAAGLVEGVVDTTTLCKPSKAEQRAEIVEYLATTPGSDGQTIKLKG